MNLLIAIMCIFVSSYTLLTCYKDPSRNISNLCLKVFIIKMLIFVSNFVAFMLSVCTLIVYQVYYNTFNFFKEMKFVYPVLITAGIIAMFPFCSCAVGPILCKLEIKKHRQFKTVSGIYMIFLSICTIVTNVIAGVFMIISTFAFMMTVNLNPDSIVPYDYCFSWHPYASLWLAFISALMNMLVTSIGIFFLVMDSSLCVLGRITQECTLYHLDISVTSYDCILNNRTISNY